MSLPTGQAPFDCVEVRFKTEERVLSQYWKIDFEYGRSSYCRFSGHDIGIVTLTGEWLNPNEEKELILIVKF
jgi:hypothetical protein